MRTHAFPTIISMDGNEEGGGGARENSSSSGKFQLLEASWQKNPATHQNTTHRLSLTAKRCGHGELGYPQMEKLAGVKTACSTVLCSGSGAQDYWYSSSVWVALCRAAGRLPATRAAPRRLKQGTLQVCISGSSRSFFYCLSAVRLFAPKIDTSCLIGQTYGFHRSDRCGQRP
jgi:Rieske Fe-S protein